jgi:SAM-dependent methyltransferase
MSNDGSLIFQYLPTATSRQTYCLKEARAVVLQYAERPNITLLDLGCGTGNSFEHFAAATARLAWIGVDIEDSPEVNTRTRTDLDFRTYDGVSIPCDSDSVDVVYCRQVFEHVRFPQELLKDVYRVLAPGGYFVGSTSQLEPLHSSSYWNFTPFGFCVLLKGAGFDEITLKPGIDGLTLISRRVFSYVKLSRLFEVFFRVESPLNAAIEFLGRCGRLDAKARNALKLVFAGQFVFLARKVRAQ